MLTQTSGAQVGKPCVTLRCVALAASTVYLRERFFFGMSVSLSPRSTSSPFSSLSSSSLSISSSPSSSRAAKPAKTLR